MTYFQNIQSLADLKKEYRRLAMLHHPDKGGDTALMQQVNTEFGKLFEVWKDKPCVSTAPTGYEHDFQGATAKEYTEYVYNEYRWKGHNYTGQSAPEITELVRAWLKETYPRYTFSVRRDGYNSILIRLMKADFEAFTKESGKIQGDINHYNIQTSDSLTDRAKEVMTNVRDFVMSYNFDESYTSGTGQGPVRLHREPKTYRGNDTWRGLLRLTGRTLFLAQGIFECEDGTETHRETGGSRNALRTDRLQRRIHTPARIYPGNGKQSGTGKAGICHCIPHMAIKAEF